MKKRVIILSILLMLTLMLAGCGDTGGGGGADDDEFVRVPMQVTEHDGSSITTSTGNYSLCWSDEFDYTGSPDSTKWAYDIGTGNWGWGNNEAQYYTNRTDNVYVDGDNMIITAQKENYSGSEYTSARVVTRGKAAWTYGYFEISAKLPAGGGTWPAIWMLPTNSAYGGWPDGGEIDIMEHLGNSVNRIMGTIHTRYYNYYNGTTSARGSSKTISNATTTFNKYALEWTESFVKIYVNDVAYFTYYRPTNSTDYKLWPFDQDFHLLLNIAMGGDLGGNIASNFTSATMEIDYVRCYAMINSNDTESPNQVVIKEALPTSSSIYIAWDEPDDLTGIKQYEIVVDGKQIAATTKTSYTITDLDPNKTYEIRVIAVDWNDNWSISKTKEIQTASIVNVPGQVPGYQAYASSGTSTQIGSDTGNPLVLVYSNSSTATYKFNVSASGNYNLSIRAATAASTLKVYLVKDGVDTLVATKDLGASFGAYRTTEIADSIAFEKGDVYLKFVCENTSATTAIMLNYFTIG